MRADGIGAIRIRWIAASIVGYAVGATLGTVLAGAIARPLSPLAGGMIVVFVFGAVVGVTIGIAQLLALPRSLVAGPRWILMTLLGAAVGFSAAAVVGELLGDVIDPTVTVAIGGGAIQITSGAAVGLGIGSAQWFVLPPDLRRGPSWIVASAVGAGLGYGAAIGLLELVEVPILKTNLIPSFGAILGLFVGAAQALAQPGGRRRPLAAEASHRTRE